MTKSGWDMFADVDTVNKQNILSDEHKPKDSDIPPEWDKITTPTKKARGKAKIAVSVEDSVVVRYDFDETMCRLLDDLKEEANLQTWVGRYLMQTYPDVLFKFSNDDAAGKGWGVKKKMSKLKADGNKAGHPDLMIMRARTIEVIDGYDTNDVPYHRVDIVYLGFLLELKTKSGKVQPHQKAYLERLRNEGYYAEVAKGFIDAKTQIDNYLERRDDA